MSKAIVKKILDHPDKDEIISKLLIGIDAKGVCEWLDVKYNTLNDKKFLLNETSLKKFQNEYLDIYTLIQEDLSRTKAAVSNGTTDELMLSVQNNQMYKSIMIENATNELDIKKMLANSAIAIETRLGQIYDMIQSDPTTLNSKVDRVLIEYIKVFGDLLDKYHKIIEAPAAVAVTHNVNVQVSEHIMVFYDIIKEILAKMDTEASLYFMDRFQETMSKLKPASEKDMPSSEIRLAEAKLLTETINKKING